MSLDELRDSIIHKRCYESANPGVRCSNAGVTRVTLVNRLRINGQLRQITEQGWGCREHSE